MKCKDKTIILTGASGGLGHQLALKLAQKGAKLALTGRDIKKLRQLKYEIKNNAGQCILIEADISTEDGRKRIVNRTKENYGSIDILINNAGSSDLVLFDQQSPTSIERIFQTNLIAPVLLTRQILPDMLDRGCGQIVNIGSGFGSIGFGCYTSYSASKFGLRGFSEALRRELNNTGVNLTYIAPRGIRTAMNSKAFYAVAKRIGFKFDDAEKVAQLSINAIEKNKKDYVIGFPEKLFVRINGLSPRQVDSGVEKQIRLLKHFLQS
ncbi:MAG: SDR family oxidoreductase [Methylococcaceae bacterium]|nr:SDR family oxidoreductase [Methylococcaceae bacterium]